MKRRVFLAINLPKEIDKKISPHCLKLAKRLGCRTPSGTPPNLPFERGGRAWLGVKFVEEGSRHITLHFLGAQTDKKIKEICDLAEKTAKNYSGFELTTGKTNAFPNKKFPRIIVLGAESREGEIKKMRAELGEGLEELGIEIDDRPWEAHITLARIKFGKIDFLRLLKEEPDELRWMAESFELVESELTSDGPEYKIVKKFQLKF